MKKCIEYSIVFFVGFVLYSLIEIIWRGFTHWSMGIAGGVCLIALYSIRKKCPGVPLLTRCFTGAVVICTIEYAAGFILNIILGWNVWDYSDRWLNIYGQICPLYGVLWFAISIPGYKISEKLETIICHITENTTNNSDSKV